MIIFGWIRTACTSWQYQHDSIHAALSAADNLAKKPSLHFVEVWHFNFAGLDKNSRRVGRDGHQRLPATCKSRNWVRWLCIWSMLDFGLGPSKMFWPTADFFQLVIISLSVRGFDYTRMTPSSEGWWKFHVTKSSKQYCWIFEARWRVVHPNETNLLMISFELAEMNIWSVRSRNQLSRA